MGYGKLAGVAHDDDNRSTSATFIVLSENGRPPAVAKWRAVCSASETALKVWGSRIKIPRKKAN